MAAAATAAARPKTARAARNARALERARSAHRAAAARPAPAAPRRKSGPVRRPSQAPRSAPSTRAGRIAQGSAVVLLDRLLRGRAWVVLVGALLAGIVFLNVSVLELNRGIARTDARAAALERTNSSLRERVAGLDSAERIQRLAEARGFVLPQPGDVTYLRPRTAADARLAATRIQPPATAQPTADSPQPAVQPAAGSGQPTTEAPAQAVAP